MFDAEQLLTVFLVSGILFGKNTVNGSRDSCLKSAVVDLTEETPDSSGAVNKSGVLFPREVIQYDHVGTFGCMCDIKQCLPFCCPRGHAASSNGCVEDEYTAYVSKFEGNVYADVVHAHVPDPCELSCIKNTSMQKYNRLSDFPQDIVFKESYCIFREVGTIEYSYGICLDRGAYLRQLSTVSIPTWYPTYHAVRGFFMLVTLIVYSVTPELKNLQGLLLRCYIGSGLTCNTFGYVAGIWTVDSSTLSERIFGWVNVFIHTTFEYAITFWLTVISFDIWWKFRRFRSNRRSNQREYEKAMFMWYSIFTWGGSIVCASMYFACLIWFNVADPLTESTLLSIIWTAIFFVELPFVICVLFCIYSFASTALTIRRQKKEIAQAVNDVDIHHKDNMSQQRFNLYLGLFTLTGCYKVFEFPLFFGSLPVYDNVLGALGALHGIFIFWIFVWKDDVKRSFWSQVIKMLHKCGVCRRPHPTSVVENGNENL